MWSTGSHPRSVSTKAPLAKRQRRRFRALLGSFANAASTRDGASKLASTVGQQSAGILDSLASTIGGPGRQSFVNSGISALNSLLGGSATSALSGALSKFTGLSQGSSSSLIGMLAPTVLGTLGDQQAEQNLDASGLARLLASQKRQHRRSSAAGLRQPAECRRSSWLCSSWQPNLPHGPARHFIP